MKKLVLVLATVVALAIPAAASANVNFPPDKRYCNVNFLVAPRQNKPVCDQLRWSQARFWAYQPDGRDCEYIGYYWFGPLVYLCGSVSGYNVWGSGWADRPTFNNFSYVYTASVTVQAET